MAIMRASAPRSEHWLRRLDDASGVDGAWQASRHDIPGPVIDLAAIAGEIYLPYLCANARALAAGESAFDVALRGAAYTQPVFRYQAKCLAQLKQRFAALPAAAQEDLGPVLERTGCLKWLRDDVG